MILKDETRNPVKKNLRIAVSANATGPYGAASPPFSPDWVEGPTAARVNNEWVVYFDMYRDKRYGAVKSADLKNWETVTDKLSMPAGARHGTVFTVSDAVLARLLVAWKDCLKQKPEWYAGDEARRIADNVLLYQRESGGWPKNIDMAVVLSEQAKAAIAKSCVRSTTCTASWMACSTARRADRYTYHLNLTRFRADERAGPRKPSRYNSRTSSAVRDSLRKHSPCPLMTTTGTQRKPGVHVRPVAESPKASKRSHLNPGFKVVSQASHTGGGLLSPARGASAPRCHFAEPRCLARGNTRIFHGLACA